MATSNEVNGLIESMDARQPGGYFYAHSNTEESLLRLDRRFTCQDGIWYKKTAVEVRSDTARILGYKWHLLNTNPDRLADWN
jgi:hypothetical protein